MADVEPRRVFFFSRRTILAEASAQTGLAIHGYSSAPREHGLFKGCVIMDVPQIPGTPPGTRRAFSGELKGDPDSAMESAAEAALRHLRDDYGIVVNDWNYPALVAARQRLVEVVMSSLETDAEIEASRQEAARYEEARDRLVRRARDLCLQFPGLLPVRAGGPSGVEYLGPPSPPAGGYDRLALDLVQIVQSAAAYEELPLQALSAA